MSEESIHQRIEDLSKKLNSRDLAFLIVSRNDIVSNMSVDERVKTAARRLSEHPLSNGYIVEIYLTKHKEKPSDVATITLKAVDPISAEKKDRIIGKSSMEGEPFYDALISSEASFKEYGHPFLKKRVNIHKIPLNKLGFLLLSSEINQELNPELKNLLEEYVESNVLPAISHAIDYEKNYGVSITDHLTELYNYRFFKDTLTREVGRETRKPTDGLSLVFSDLDNFKQYNDKHGHPQGDELLKKIARLFKMDMRETDFVARYAGDEFAMIMPNTRQESAARKVESVRDLIEKHYFDEEKEKESGKITASFGIAAVPYHTLDADELLVFADEALYYSKRNGGNKVSIYSPSILKTVK